jgi:hypothetical protein
MDPYPDSHSKSFWNRDYACETVTSQLREHTVIITARPLLSLLDQDLHALQSA